MHQTTLRFTPSLWAALEREAPAAGVSVAQYVRDAVLARVTHSAGLRGEGEFDALDGVGEGREVAAP
jgi:hypothetical protein